MAAGLVRWPKLVRTAGQEKNVGTGFDGEAHFFAFSPRKYSNVVEAYLWAGLMMDDTTGSNFKGTSRFAFQKDAPGGSILSILPGTGAVPTIVDTVPLPANADFFATGKEVECKIRHEEFHSVTSDVFIGGEFLDVFNAIGEGEYVIILPDVQITQAVPGNEKMTMAGLKLLQRPGRVNRSVTQHAIWDPVHSPNANNLFFPRTPADFGVHRFRYTPSEFENLTGVFFRTFMTTVPNAGSRTVTWRLQTGNPNGVATTVYEQAATAVPENLWVWESIDLRSLLTEGELYWWEMRVSNFDFINTSPKIVPAWMDYEQQSGAGFSTTTTFYSIPHGKGSAAVNDIPPDKWWITGDLLSAADYQNVVNATITRPMRQWVNGRSDAGANLQGDFRTKRVEETDADRQQPPPYPGCVFSSSPDFFMGQDTPSIYTYDEDTVNNSDELPFNCIGERMVYGEIAFSFSTGGLLSSLTFAITYKVPNEPTPALGDLFPLDPFDPEGCAATAAGGGIPGILIISNGQEVPKKFVPAKLTGEQIEDAGMPRPFKGEESLIADNSTVNSTGASPTGGLGIGRYEYRYTFRNCCTGKESDPSETIVVSTLSASPRAQVDLSFAGVRIPGDPQICEICVYRTIVDGAFPVMAKVGCIDVDTSPLLFVDDEGDSQLDFTNDPLFILNAPMPCVPYITDFKRRIFGVGDIPTLSPAGTVTVQNGSVEVEGDLDVVWDRCLEGRYIHLENDCRFYLIDRVLPPTEGTSPPLQRLCLIEEYEGQSRTGENYIVCGDANIIYSSEPEEPECWPVVNQIPVEPGDGDFCTGISSSFNRLIVCKRKKTYAMTYRDIPAIEVVDPVRISPDIGCVGPRTFQQVENSTVWLADRGIAIFDGRGVQHLPVSDDISNIFTQPDDPLYIRRNSRGLVIEAVAVNYPAKQQYWLGVPTVRSNRGFDLVIVWDYKEQTIFLYEFCNQFLSMVLGKDTDGNQRIYMGDDKGFLWVADTGLTDGAGTPGDTGTLRGVTATVPDTFSFTDPEATFLEGGIPVLGDFSGEQGFSPFLDEDPLGLAGVCVYFRNPGETEWTQRVIWAALKQRIFFTPPYAALEVGAEYMIAPIDFLAEFKPWNLGSNQMVKRAIDLFVIHEPEDFDSRLQVEFLADFEDTDRSADGVESDDSGVAGDRLFRMSHKTGKQRMSLGRLVHTFQQLRLSNFAPEEPIRILNVVPTIARHAGH